MDIAEEVESLHGVVFYLILIEKNKTDISCLNLGLSGFVPIL